MTKATLLLACAPLVASAQVLTIDNFDALPITMNGNGVAVQEGGDSSDVVGGRRVIIFGNGSDGSSSQVTVADGLFTFANEDESDVSLTYGVYPGIGGGTALNVKFGSMSLTASTVPQSFSVTAERWSSAGSSFGVFSFTSAGTVPLEAEDFSGTANLMDVDGLRLVMAPPNDTFALEGAEVSPVPEPSTYAAIFGAGLVLFAVARRRAQNV